MNQRFQSVTWDFGTYITTVVTTIFTGYINGIALLFLNHIGIIGGDIYENATIAAITEPISTKLFPVFILAIGGILGVIAAVLALLVAFPFLGRDAGPLFIGTSAVLTLISTSVLPDVGFRDVNLVDKRILTGLRVGLVMGIMEIYTKFPTFTWFYWENPSYTPIVLPAVLFHVFSALVIVSAFLISISPQTDRTGWYTGGALVVVFGVHWIWNSILAETSIGYIDNFWAWYLDIGHVFVEPLIQVLMILVIAHPDQS